MKGGDMSFDESLHPRGKTGQFREKATTPPSGSLDAGVHATMEPREIDTQLVGLYSRHAALSNERAGHQETVDRAQRATRPSSALAATRSVEAIERLDVKLASIEREIAPLEAEFARRPWSRAFYVAAPGGHLHRSRQCSTCRPSTKFTWVTELSGSSEDEIVTAAGETACAVCFPDAPANAYAKPRTFRTLEDEEREAKIKAKAKRDAERHANKAAKAITTPDGEPLRIGWETIKTEASAKNALNRAMETLVADGLHYQYPNREYIAETQGAASKLIAALAHKQQRTAEEVSEEARARATKKLAKQYADSREMGD